MLSQLARRGPWNDCANLPAVIAAASQQTRIGLVLADAEFDSERNHTYIRKHRGAQSVIPAKRGKKTWRVHGVRAEMRHAFPQQTYRRRALIESLFSSVKRKLSARAPGRSLRTQMRRPKPAKLAVNPELRRYVQDRLAGSVQRPDGSVAGPLVGWRGRRHGPRKDRRWGQCWSPEQISGRLRVDFPDDESMRVSHEAIYQSLYVQGRGALRRELTACLRTGRALRAPRNRTSRGNRSFVTDELLISERPAEVDDRAVPGHWEGDLILGVDRSAIGTLVERSSRFTMLLHLPPIEGHNSPRVKAGPPITGAGAGAVRNAIADTIGTLPEQLRRSLTWDQGIEMAQHVQLRLDTGLQIYFCDPRSPWQRGTNENTNGLLRQYFPRGTDLARHSAEELEAVAAALNGRPRKTLGWRTPAEALTEYLTAAA